MGTLSRIEQAPRVRSWLDPGPTPATSTLVLRAKLGTFAEALEWLDEMGEIEGDEMPEIRIKTCRLRRMRGYRVNVMLEFEGETRCLERIQRDLD